MCDYLQVNKCSLTNEACPYVYFCNISNMWKPSKYMPDKCKVALTHEVPKGYYRVRDVRNGYLYIDIEGQTVKVKNPFTETPAFVKATKTKTGWKLRK